jgi:hypothetical protein
VDFVWASVSVCDQGHQVDEKYVTAVDNADNILICFASFV